MDTRLALLVIAALIVLFPLILARVIVGGAIALPAILVLSVADINDGRLLNAIDDLIAWPLNRWAKTLRARPEASPSEAGPGPAARGTPSATERSTT